MTPASILPLAGAACSGALAFGVMLRDRRSGVHWAFFAGMLVCLAENILGWLATGAVAPLDKLVWEKWRFLALSPLIGVWLTFSLMYARGNAGEFIRRWTLPLAAAFVLPVVLVLAFRERLMSLHENPAGGWIIHLETPGFVLCMVLLIGSVAVLMNLERTFRASVGTMRWRIKFMLLGVAVMFVARLYTSSEALLFRSVDPALENLNSGAVAVAALLMLRSFSRTGHFDVDVYPSQTVLQGSLTVLLAGLYLLLVGLLAQVVTYFGGDAAFNLKALVVLLAVVLLAVLLQSDRLRLGLRRFVSRHFQRPLYDYRTAWKRFTEGTASCVEQKELARSLVRLVAEMFQVLSVTIWLVNDHRDSLVLAASTSTPETSGRSHGLEEAETTAVVDYFRRHTEPVDLEHSSDKWALALKQWHPSDFPELGGNRVCVPMLGRNEFLGVILLGDRVGGVAFSLQDFDLLKCVGDHAAASLLNVQLSEKLLQARELEAFQTMATFFVHDLKNAGSTLNLMLQNLPVHFDDPVFRADALRGIGKTVSHINRLISRLGLLRHELTIKPVTTDLNDVVTQVLAGLEPRPGATLTRNLAQLPRVRLDPEQMQKVVTNLVLNAIEAIGEDGRVEVVTAADNNAVSLLVRDNGCGMSPEFLHRSLFRPFQTTKAGGLGIGMFQSRMIVEAHGGKIAVASESGRGTTFQVFLPLAQENR